MPIATEVFILTRFFCWLVLTMIVFKRPNSQSQFPPPYSSNPSPSHSSTFNNLPPPPSQPSNFNNLPPPPPPPHQLPPPPSTNGVDDENLVKKNPTWTFSDPITKQKIIQDQTKVIYIFFFTNLVSYTFVFVKLFDSFT